MNSYLYRARIWLTRLSLVAVICLLSHSAAIAASETANVVIGGRPVPFVVSPFIGNDGKVFCPVDVVHVMGASYQPNTDAATVTITSSSGKVFTVPYQAVKGRLCVDLQQVAAQLGATTEFLSASHTLVIRARLLAVRQENDTLEIYTSYPVYYTVKPITKPNRVYVDMAGLDLAAFPANTPVSGSALLHIRSGQLTHDTVRITVDLKRGASFKVLSPLQSSAVQVALSSGPEETPVAAVPVPNPVLPTKSVPLASNLPHVYVPPTPNGIRITGVHYRALDDGTSQILVTANGEAHYHTETLDNPQRLAFDLQGASVDPSVDASQTVESPDITAIRAGLWHLGEAKFGRVVIDLTHLVAYHITANTLDGETTYLITLGTAVAATPATTPVNISITPNSLRGVVVVVDPGHGGKDDGSSDPSGRTHEKNITLAISKDLRDTLLQAGATVYMTRDDDSFPPLMSRAPFAIAHHANYYISIHCDSLGAGHEYTTHTGSTVYYHGYDGICRRFAGDVSTRVSQVSGLPSNGTKSDYIRFNGIGFAVLRGSTMPAILVECGYMNNPRDLSKLQDTATQRRIAVGIVAGLRDFRMDQSANASE